MSDDKPRQPSALPATVQLQGWLSNNAVLPDQESLLKLLVRVSGRNDPRGRPALNVCLAIDRSFSMQDDHKLDRAKEAAIAFIDALRPKDIFSLVDFGTDVHTAIEAQAGLSKEVLKRAVLGMRAHSATNLFGALHAAGAQVARQFDAHRINRVILLSDGVPTEGVTGEEEILDVARSARHLGIGISTLGLGEDYDEVLLAGISEITGANHYYVENGNDIPGILSRELARMESLVARGLRLRIHTSPGVELTLSNERYRRRCHTEPEGVTVELDDLERGGTLPILFQMSVPPLPEGAHALGEISIQFSQTGPSGALSVVSSTVPLEITSTTDPEQVRQGINRQVLRQWEEVDALQVVATAVDRGSRGAMPARDVARVIQQRVERLERAGSARASFLERIGRTIVEEGTVSPGVAKKTIVARMASQQGETN